MVRGILDGHIILDREIAERGRFPAINIRKSVSRSLPKAANNDENNLLLHGRRMLSTYDDARTIIQTGLYTPGSDDDIDEAIRVYPALEALASERSKNCAASFGKLQSALG